MTSTARLGRGDPGPSALPERAVRSPLQSRQAAYRGGAAEPEEDAVPISVFLLDDHEIVRRGIAQLLETQDDIRVVGEAGTAAQALARIPALRPDVAILDVRLPDGEGVSVCRDVRSAVAPPPACLMLSRSPTTRPSSGRSWPGRRGTCSSRSPGRT
jgi:PleD family two-component response regulator